MENRQGILQSICDVPLAEAAMQWREAWPQAWRRVLEGGVRAEKRRGRWFVAREDVQRVVEEKRAAAAVPA